MWILVEHIWGTFDETAVCRAKRTTIFDSRNQYIRGIFDLVAFKVILGFIECTCLKIAINMKTAGRGALNLLNLLVKYK